MNLYNLSSYDYYLPKELIAQILHDPADESKLLYFKDGNLKDLIFKDIKDILTENDLLFFNNSKVIKARIKWNLQNNLFTLSDIWKAEIFFLKKYEWNIFEALIKPWKKFKVWKKIYIKDYPYEFEIIDNIKDWRLIRLNSNEDIFDVLQKIGIMPLPPYIRYKKEKEKLYQAIIATKPWSVAAPTASLHFTEKLLTNLKSKNINMLYSALYIGQWTFKIVDTENILNYDIHEEFVEVPCDIFKKISENKEKNIVAVWTTSTRILESLPFLYAKLHLDNDVFWNEIIKNIKKEDIQRFIPWNVFINNDNISFQTKLFIYPWFKFYLVKKLITNFHLPKSSLLMLVSAFMWYENMRKAYDYAIKNKYTFFSFWDAMMIDNT